MSGTKRTKQTIAIAGLGLIGASLALALRGDFRVIGCDSDADTERYAAAHAIVDEIVPMGQWKGVACVVLSTPLSSLCAVAEEAYRAVGDTAVITDVGSVKSILEGARGRVVGGHPMAGTEHSGIRAAKPHLFENAYYCVVPYAHSREEDVAFVVDLVRRIKAKPVVLSPQAHDAAVADFSHMPHLAAYALSRAALGGDVTVAGSGFMDCTRIACSDPAFWTEVFRRNRENVLRSLDKFTDELAELRRLLDGGEYDALRARIGEAQRLRKDLALSRTAGDYTVTVDLKDEIGSIGGVVTLLAARKASIADIRILDSREGAAGALQLAFSSLRDAECAKAALAQAGYTVSR